MSSDEIEIVPALEEDIKTLEEKLLILEEITRTGASEGFMDELARDYAAVLRKRIEDSREMIGLAQAS